MQATDVFAGTVGDAARQDIIDANQLRTVAGELLGHGSEEQWSGDDIFDNSAVSSLTNGSQLPVFLIMDCLNGFFQDVYEQPLAVTLDACAKWWRSRGAGIRGIESGRATNQADKLGRAEHAMNRRSYPALGEAILKAKSGISDPTVRRTYNLFGDPAMQVKLPGSNFSGIH